MNLAFISPFVSKAEMYVMQLLLALALTGVLVNLKFKKIQSER